MKVQNEFVLREIAGDYVIIPTGKTVLSFNGLITVNEVGAGGSLEDAAVRSVI